ncbi:MAG: DUF2157 domain-containing protein [Phycisphaerae bacterium]|nr:DUF2157 domain-containing protein [Phycisphaerae bacterium]
MAIKLPGAWFRRKLKEQLGILESEGVLSPSQVQQLTDRYRLGNLAAETMQSLLTTIYVIGSVLIGIGVISFVAAHWNDLGRSVKLALIFSAMLLAHAAGFYLWKIHGRFPKLGHTLVLLGTLIFGANIGLVAQIFHIMDNPYNAFLAWCIGAVAMAYAVESLPHGILALIIAIIYAFGECGPNRDIVFWWPFFILAVFVPMVYFLRSKTIAWLTAIVFVFSIVVRMAQRSQMWEEGFGIIVGLAISGLGVLAWGLIQHSAGLGALAAEAGSVVGVFSVSLAAFLCSFHEICQEIAPVHILKLTGWSINTMVGVSVLAISGIAAGITLVRGLNRVKFLLLITAVLIVTMTLIRPPGMTYLEMTIAGNGLFLLMDCILFYASFVYEDRRIFWASVLMAVTLVVARTLEYETELLIKAAVFTGCGIGLIAAGVFFERYLRDRRLSHA